MHTRKLGPMAVTFTFVLGSLAVAQEGGLEEASYRNGVGLVEVNVGARF